MLNIPCPLSEDGITPQPIVLDFSEDARTYFYNWNNSIIDEVNGIEDDNEVESRKVKLNGNAARLALILQVMRWAAGECSYQRRLSREQATVIEAYLSLEGEDRDLLAIELWDTASPKIDHYWRDVTFDALEKLRTKVFYNHTYSHGCGI